MTIGKRQGRKTERITGREKRSHSNGLRRRVLAKSHVRLTRGKNAKNGDDKPKGKTKKQV